MKTLRKVQLALWVTLLLGASIPMFRLRAYANPDVLTRDPSAEYQVVRGWNFPQKAFSSDDQRAVGAISGGIHVWLNYSFQNHLGVNDTITKVEIGVEHYETEFNEQLRVAVTWDGGTNWSAEAVVASEDVEVTDWLDATGVTVWDLTKLSDPNLRVKVRYLAGVGGCYPDSTYLVVYDEASKSYALKNPSDIYAGDTVLAWHPDKGIYHEHVLRIDTHQGTWKLLDIYSGNMTFHTSTDKIVWDKHITVTDTHPIWDPVTGSVEKAHTFQVGDYLSHVDKGELVMLPITRIERHSYTGPVYNIVLPDKQSCIFAKSFSEWELSVLDHVDQWQFLGSMSNIVLAIKVPYTGYLDWVPVRVTYTPADGYVDCNWIGVNQTYAGYATCFSTNWQDLNDTDGLSHYRFFSNNTGAWVNETWTNTWRNVVWADHDTALNDTASLIIAFRFYVNDSTGIEYGSTFCFFNVSELVTCPDLGAAGGVVKTVSDVGATLQDALVSTASWIETHRGETALIGCLVIFILFAYREDQKKKRRKVKLF